MLLEQGDDDRNVQFSQMTGLVQLLRAHNVYHEVIVFTDDTHEPLLHSRYLYVFNRLEEFLGRFLKGAAAALDGRTITVAQRRRRTADLLADAVRDRRGGRDGVRLAGRRAVHRRRVRQLLRLARLAIGDQAAAHAAGG